MDNKLKDYNWQQLLEEDAFIFWILKGEYSQDWETLIKKHPELSKEVEKAKKILLLLQVKNEDLDAGSVKSLWKDVEDFNEDGSVSERKKYLMRTFSLAASFLLILSLGIITYYYYRGEKEYFQFSETDLRELHEAHILLPTGERIAIKSRKSKIMVSREVHQLVVNDSLVQLEDKIPSKTTSRFHELVIPYGKQSEIVLVDGSVIWLNAGSRLAFPARFDEKNREVYLEGEACFQVAKDESKPFLVRTEGVNIEVLGTIFNVSSYPDQDVVETVLISGSVSLSKKDDSGTTAIRLSPYEKGAFSKVANEIHVTHEPNAREHIAWVNGWLEYHRESLNSVLVRLERYYNVKFILPQGFPADDKISGKLDIKESLEHVLLILADAAEIDFTIDGDKVFIQRKESQ